MSKQARATECDVCEGNLKKSYKADKFHAHSQCHNLIALFESRSKRIFGE